MDLISPLKSAFTGSGRYDDDIMDRVNSAYTVGLLILFAVVVTTGSYVGDPIACWAPAQFTDSFIGYTDRICWVSNTYYIPMQSDIPDAQHLKPHLSYYQWTPLILMFSALLFYMPRWLWSNLNDRSGLVISDISDAAQVFTKASSSFEEREKIVTFISSHIDRYLTIRRLTRKCSDGNACKKCLAACCHVGRRQGNYLVVLYLFCKVLFVVNCVLQLFLMNYVLGFSYHMYGFSFLSSIARGEDMSESSFFPRVTLCDFHVREVGITHRYTVQCVLSINLFNEKVFLILWFWLFFVGIATILSFVRWLFRLLFPADRLAYVKRNIKGALCAESVRQDKAVMKDFVFNYLEEDGHFAMRMVSQNSSDIVAAEILNGLWRLYKKKIQKGDDIEKIQEKA